VTYSFFNGALTLTEEGRYVWKDGEDWTPVFQPLTINHYNFLVQGVYVIVPRAAVQRHRDLAWVPEVGLAVPPAVNTPRAFLVPQTIWDEKAKIPIGVLWDARDEPIVLDKAQDLGWEWSGDRLQSIHGDPV